MEPGLQKLAAEFDGKASIVKVDCGASPDLADKYSVAGLPTLVLLQDGKETNRVTSTNLDEIKQLIESAL